MLKAGRIPWLLFVLFGLMLVPLFLLGAKLLVWETPSVKAAGVGIDSDTKECTKSHENSFFGGTVVVDTNEVLCSQLTAFGGRVAILGDVKGDVVTFNSEVSIQGSVFGNIHAVGGMVKLQSGSHVNGNIHLYGSKLVKATDAQYVGSTTYPAKDLGVGGIFGSNEGFNFPFWPILTWVALGLLLTTLLPEHLAFVRTTAIVKTQRSFLIGLLTMLLAPPVSIVLFALILSIPLAFLLVLALIAAWALGTVSIGWHVGEFIMRKVSPDQSTRPVQIIVGLTALVLLGSLPYIGWLISIGVGLLGLGAVFLSRFGTRLYSPPKHPLTL